MANEDLLDTGELEPSVSTIEHAWVGGGDGGESNWLLSGGEPRADGIHGGVSRSSISIIMIMIVVVMVIVIHGVDGDSKESNSGDETFH